MNGYTNVLLTTLLSWVQGIARDVWTLISGEDGSFLRWIADNWLVLAIMLCAVCVLIDLTVYMIRWRPYKVWASFFRRLRRKKPEEAQAQVRQWLYADGSERTEQVRSREKPKGQLQPAPRPIAEPVPMAEPIPEEEALQPMAMDEAAEEAMPETEVPATRQRRASRRRSAASGVRRLLADPTEDETQLSRYRAAPPAVDKEQAYHKPYIPPQWKRPGSGGTDLPG